MNLDDILSDPRALAFATAAYGRPVAPTMPIVMVTANVEASALITPAAPKTGTRVVRQGSKSARSSAAKPIDAMTALPSKGTLSAADFLTSLRFAGKRQATDQIDEVDEETGEVKPVLRPRFSDRGVPIMIHDEVVQRLDERAAVAAFIGWDLSQPHGTQLDAARLMASSTLSRMARLSAGGQMTQYAHRSPEAHAARWSAAGFVKGMPNAVAKLLADLAGRERLATEDMVTFANLRQFTQAGDRSAFERTIAKEFPSTKGIAPIVDAEGKEVGYQPVTVQNPIAEKITQTCADPAKLMILLASLEALAVARLDAIREDIAGLDSEAPTADQIERAHMAMLGRGAPTIEEGIALLDTTPRA